MTEENPRRYKPQNQASSKELQRRMLAHWEAAHGTKKADPTCAGCRGLQEAYDAARKREKK